MQLVRLISSLAVLCLIVSIAATPASSEPLHLILPTSNDALLRDDGPAFFQYTDRTFDGVRSRPWEGGQYGFVRNPRHTSAGIVFTRFHEGVDIKPIHRDGRGEPLDTVRTIDDGYVVYVNNVEGLSSYGKYVVVEHWWSGSPFYSLYAHLNAVHVSAGDQVYQGDRLGRLGYTGRGLNKRRAHLHFEINMMLNESFGDWYEGQYRARNRHDVYNGINLSGLDVADLYISLQRNPWLTIDEFILSQEAFFKVAVPASGPLDIAYRYDWLNSKPNPPESEVSTWEISLTASGLPVRVEPSSRSISKPVVTAVARSPVSYGYVTNGRLAGSGDKYHLSRSGERYAELLMLTYPDRLLVRRERPVEVEDRHRQVVDRGRSVIREVSDSDTERLRSW